MMARFLVEVTMPDDDEDIVEYGTRAEAEAFVQEGSQLVSQTVRLVEWDGPNDATRCYSCGCPSHVGKPCPCTAGCDMHRGRCGWVTRGCLLDAADA